MNYLIQVKLKSKVLKEYNQTADSFSLDDTINDLTEKLSGKANLIEIFTYDSLMDSDSIKFLKKIPLICIDK